VATSAIVYHTLPYKPGNHPGRGDGPHPYEIGADWVQRYFQVMQGCARAAQIRLEQTAAAR
jgi:hypothetical protein